MSGVTRLILVDGDNVPMGSLWKVHLKDGDLLVVASLRDLKVGPKHKQFLVLKAPKDAESADALLLEQAVLHLNAIPKTLCSIVMVTNDKKLKSMVQVLAKTHNTTFISRTSLEALISSPVPALASVSKKTWDKVKIVIAQYDLQGIRTQKLRDRFTKNLTDAYLQSKGVIVENGKAHLTKKSDTVAI